MQASLLSPSGDRLALTVPGNNGRLGLFVLDLRSPETSISRAALYANFDIDQVAWVDDERLVYTLSDGQQPGAERRRLGGGLFSTRFDGTEQRPLIERDWRHGAIDASVQRYTLPRDHELLHVPRAEPGADAPADDDLPRAGEVIVGKWHANRQELTSFEPLLLDVRRGEARQIELAGTPGGAVRWWFTPRGEPRVVLTRAGGREALHWRETRAAGQPVRWRRLAEAPQGRLPFIPVWVGEGNRLYVRQAHGPAGEGVVSPYDFTAGAPGKPLVLTPGFDFSGELLDDRAGRDLLGVRVDADGEGVVWFDPAIKALQGLADAALPGRVNRITCRRCGAADAVMLVRSFSDRVPGELYLWRRTAAAATSPADAASAPAPKGRWQKLGSVRPDVDPARMARVDLHRIKARDGRDLPVWLTQPAGMKASGDARPAIVLVHGGPWVRHGHWQWEPMAQFLASRGWLVIEPEFRGSDGYGRAHLEAGFRQWGQAMQDDVADALLWARAKGLASDRACIAGGSYGGYSTLMGLVRHPELYQCGWAWVAVTDLLLFLEGSWWVNDDIADSGRRYSLPMMVGDAERDRAMLLENSPVTQAHRIKAPLLLVWGAEDLRVPIAHGERLRKALQAAGREPEWVVYPDEGHGLALPANQIDMAQRLERFFSQHLGPPRPSAAPAAR
jgi:dipeptidyl aminopeptidase/acylaminoacyl peptidase